MLVKVNTVDGRSLTLDIPRQWFESEIDIKGSRRSVINRVMRDGAGHTSDSGVYTWWPPHSILNISFGLKEGNNG